MGEKFILNTTAVITNKCGEPVSCGEILFVAKGTNTPITIYSDECMKVPTANPRKLDQHGAFPDVYVPSDVDFDAKIYDDCGCHIGTIPDASTTSLVAPIFTTLPELRAYCDCVPYVVYAPEGGCPVRYRRIDTDPLPVENLPDVVVGICFAWEACEFTIDKLCAITPVADPDSNDYLAGCFDGVFGKAPVSDVLALVGSTCIELDSISDQTCSIQQIALATDDEGCSRLQTYSASAALILQTRLRDWLIESGLHPVLEVTRVWPDFLVDPLDIYDITDLRADDALGLGIINESKLLNSVFSSAKFSLNCPTLLDVQAVISVVAVLSLDASLFSWRYREQGDPDWTYPRTGSGIIAGVGLHNAVAPIFDQTEFLGNYNTGDWEIQFFHIPLDKTSPVRYYWRDRPTDAPYINILKRIT